MENSCIFCKIVSKQNENTEIEYENDNIVIFKDIRPASDFHYLAVSKKHIVSAKCLKADDEPLLTEMENALKGLLESKNVNKDDAIYGFHWPPFTSVKHLHMHGIAPASKMRFLPSWVFKAGTPWFCTTDYVRQWIQK